MKADHGTQPENATDKDVVTLVKFDSGDEDCDSWCSWLDPYTFQQLASLFDLITLGLFAWLRRRLRMCFWKQWRYVRTKVRELLKLGTAKKTAILTALSRKGPWHLSRTLATQTGMTNQWLSESLGLVSIRALWITLHYPT